MKKTIVFLCFTLFLFATSTSAQLLSPTSHIEGTILPSTQSLFIGTVDVSGDFQGYPLDMLPENPYINNVSVFPLLGSTVLNDIDRVTLIDRETLNLDSYQDYVDLTNLTQFTDVDITLQNGLFLLGSDQGTISIDVTFEYAIATTYPIQLQNISSRFLILLSTTKNTARFQGELSAVLQYDQEGKMQITDPGGTTLWESSFADTLLLIEDEQYLVTQRSSMYLYPLVNNSETLKLQVTAAPNEAVDIQMLIDKVTSVAEGFGDIPDISSMIQGFSSFVTAAESIINGGMLLIETSDNFVIDDSLQQFTKLGFTRGSQLSIQLFPSSGTSTVKGDAKLVFLGDHFYSIQAKESEDGFSVPFVPIFLWIIGIAAFILVKFYLKRENNEAMDQKLKYYALVFHICAILIVFVLVDREISFKFGYSALDALFGQGFSLVFLLFISLQLSIWSLGYLFFAFPLKLCIDSVLLYFGFGRKGKHLGKGIALFSIWFFASFYVTLILNLLFLFLNPAMFFPL